MNGDVSVDFGSALFYLEDRIRTLFGKDPETQAWTHKLHQQLRSALEQARWVQCVGMPEPIPIEAIYQPLNLIARSRETDVFELIRQQENAIVFAGPGRGKSTLLNWLYIRLLPHDNIIPLLFILRSQDAVASLAEFVARLSAGKSKDILKKKRPLLLIDGYDEVEVEDRKSISRSLTLLKSAKLGGFILTCRTFYDIYDLAAPQYYLSSFTDDDSIKFIEMFSKGLDADIDPTSLVAELRRRGFRDFLLHPLLLCLICILKTGPLPDLPNNTLGLLKRVFDTLTLRWDQSRGINRRSAHRLDGEERVRCLMRIAYKMSELREGQEMIEGVIREHLQMIQRRGIDARGLLREMAQWYGVLVPVEQDRWQFVHKSIHDYLAARYWVESGRFTPANVVTNWDARVAYASCLSPDATWRIKESLDRGNTLYVLSECMYNYAPFETEPIAESVVALFEREITHCSLRYVRAVVEVKAPVELFRLASDRFLLHLITKAADRLSPQVRPSGSSGAAMAVVLCGLGEAVSRRKPVDNPALARLVVRQFGSTTPVEAGGTTYVLRNAFVSGTS